MPEHNGPGGTGRGCSLGRSAGPARELGAVGHGIESIGFKAGDVGVHRAEYGDGVAYHRCGASCDGGALMIGCGCNSVDQAGPLCGCDSATCADCGHSSLPVPAVTGTSTPDFVDIARIGVDKAVVVNCFYEAACGVCHICLFT